MESRERRKLIWVYIGVLFMGLFEVVGIGSIMPFFSVATDPSLITTNDKLSLVYNKLGFTDPMQFLTVLGLAVIGFIVFSNVSQMVITWVIEQFTAMRLYTTSTRIFRQYLSQNYAYFLNQSSSELGKNILSEVAEVFKGVLMSILEVLSSIMVCLFILVMLFLINPVITLVAAAFFGGIYSLIFIFVRKKVRDMGRARRSANIKRFKVVLEAFSGIKDVKLLGKENFFLDRFEKPCRTYAMSDAHQTVVGTIPRYLLELFAFGGILGLSIFYLRKTGTLNAILPTLSAFAVAGYRLLPALQKMFKGITKIRFHLPVVDMLYERMTTLPSTQWIEDAEQIEKLPFDRDIRLERLSFQYPETEKPVIPGLDLIIPKNSTIGFVGPTGCGKTTLIDICLGLLEPDGGALLVDGVPVTNENRKSWQRNLGYVPQAIFLADDTIAANIAFGWPKDKIDRERIREVARLANLDQFVETELPKGYDTMVGDRGMRLSGGQRQRLGIARALYHDPEVLILDEATSALDGFTEQAIMDAINNLSGQKTLLMIAHRITTVKKCDTIILMDKGVIRDSGTYDELYARDAAFKRLADGVPEKGKAV